MRINKIEISPVQPLLKPKKYSKKVWRSKLKSGFEIKLKGVAEVKASTAPFAISTVLFINFPEEVKSGMKDGVSHFEPIKAGKLIKRNARPVKAGLNTFAPIPPKRPFAIIRFI